MEMRHIMPAALPILASLLLALPAAADERCFSADQDSGSLTFSGRQEGARFTGGFETFTVRYCMPDDDPAAGRIQVSVDTSSVRAGNRDRNEALGSEDFFHPQRFPCAEWHSSAIDSDGDTFRAEGELTIKDITGGQDIAFTLSADGDGYIMQGSSRILRLDYQVGTGEFDDTDFIDNEVQIAFELRLRPAE